MGRRLTGPDKIHTLGAVSLPAAGAMEADTMLCSDLAERRRCADAGDHHAGQPVRAVQVSENHSATQTFGVANWQGPGGAELAAGRAEGTATTEAAKGLVVE